MENIDYNEVLIHAARKGDVPVMEELLQRGVDLNCKDAKGYTPLIIACYNNQPEAVSFLLDKGADINGADFGGNTALMGVCFKGYPDIAQILIDRGVNIDQMHGNGGTALMFAAMFGRNGMVRQLLDAGADKALTDVRGLTVYDIALQQGNEEAIEILG
jgi:ankyrin repeat protein